uniref:glycerol-3-phosphate 1-O-acyltransferase PlsY n=1 Tax=Ningiella ruwaisensis TaxID=2364274 RepID=UPI0010A070F2|nr:glycerol-3-phosphate 1-O-acyltransferase PlsY [Ningiella ruwaisensis]
MTTWIVFYCLAAYLLGSVSSAILLCKLLGLPDPRTQGSLNPGATNVVRIAGKRVGVFVLVFDILKGAVPAYLAYLSQLSEFAIGLVAICACLGHMYPVFFQFKGGKAVATALGAMLPMGWALAAGLLSTWVLVFAISKLSSLAAIVTVSLAPVFTYFYKPQFTFSVTMLSVLIIVKHRSNISRLINRKEREVGQNLSNKHRAKSRQED